ncbi:hypothetical protein [Helicobacter ganmani]|uniref:hypothetical protein n=1 Tax=Helicobacter ganmani TaxID=60246 RepID=UPI003A8B6576
MIWKECDLLELHILISNSMIDLQKEYSIELIRISTSVSITNLNVESSCDLVNWTKIPLKFNICGDKMLEICFDRQVISRYLKLNIDLFSNQIKVFTSKYDALCLCSRGDGFGSRMLNFLYVKYIIDKCPNFKFGFTWSERKNIENEVYIATKEELFTKEYLDLYCYNEKLCYENLFFSGSRSIADLQRKKVFTHSFGDYQSSVFLGKSHFSDFDLDDFKEKCPKIFEDIRFSHKYKNLYNQSKKILNNFVGIHMRSGDVVYNISQRKMYFTWQAPMNRVCPPELVVAIAIELIKNGEKVVIFSDDIHLALKCKKYCNSDLVYAANELLDKNLGRFEKDFCELILLSCAKLIIAPQESTYSILASYIGKSNIKTFNEYMPFNKQYQKILENIQFDSHRLQKASTYGFLTKLAENLHLKDEEISTNLKSLVEYDPDNSGAVFKLCDIKFNQKKERECEEILQKLNNFSLIAEDILWIRACATYEFQKYFSNYLRFAVPKYPNISYIASIIRQKAFDNEIFKDHLLKLLLEQPTPQLKAIAKEKPIPSIYLVTAKHRIHNHLAYKLGSAMILNSKSLWGYIRMPYVLSYIKETHRKEIADYEARVAKNPSLKLPPLESYTDYKQALKEKECFTYKLGKALITANSVRGGGESLLICNFFKKCVS